MAVLRHHRFDERSPPSPESLSCPCRSGKHLIVFLEKGPLYLVAVSSADEPPSALRLQLELLHAHFLAILTDNFDKMLARNPRFEPRRLLGVRAKDIKTRDRA